MPVFKKVVPAQGGDPIYRDETNNKVVDAKELEEKFPAVKEELDLADPGTQVDSESVTKENGDGVVDHNGDPIDDGKKDKPSEPETPKPAPAQPPTDASRSANPFTKPVPDSNPGFGFPRKKGKTVDVFDGKTPHTHIRARS